MFLDSEASGASRKGSALSYPLVQTLFADDSFESRKSVLAGQRHKPPEPADLRETCTGFLDVHSCGYSRFEPVELKQLNDFLRNQIIPCSSQDPLYTLCTSCGSDLDR
ncbi:hypothetical protein F2P81_010190 [Scophthalmus maximus]|uniref:Uncharacterized protein n=1 Tax=Scophthalmus maximus TaxID=52904 RepID=A0A6A4SQ71_SCOMX|nr:hypothetical protein F2P81_010190 [Scophthalmus maximus]